MQDQDSIDDI